jgi:cytochrome c556
MPSLIPSGDYFPPGSEQGGNTSASPKIWEDMAGFQKQLADLRTHTDTVIATPPQDLQAFQAALGPIGQGCGTCHQVYRLSNN